MDDRVLIVIACVWGGAFVTCCCADVNTAGISVFLALVFTWMIVD